MSTVMVLLRRRLWFGPPTLMGRSAPEQLTGLQRTFVHLALEAGASNGGLDRDDDGLVDHAQWHQLLSSKKALQNHWRKRVSDERRLS